SKEIFFSPKKLAGQTLRVNIGTAGSISLFLQQLLPVALKTNLDLHIIGGTDVAFAPATAYLQKVLLPKLNKANARFSVETLAPGFFPKGRGRVHFKSKHASLPLKPIACALPSGLKNFECVSKSSGLPLEVSKNQALAAKKIFLEKFPNADWLETIQSNPARKETIGSSIDIFAVFENTVLGTNALGKKGKPAEEVGLEAANQMLWELQAEKPVDSHLADQLLLFMALAKGKSEIATTEFTSHCATNIKIIEEFLPCKFEIEGEHGKSAKISVNGVSFK
ncbi:MAG: RNA 3'-terminal phosphate cyclase, partial [Candidatus Diapherotrites archaeon]|nr:RNA 3'-terminal phosphate cyclase [Candidatus Diapherotrites archaeon]